MYLCVEVFCLHICVYTRSMSDALRGKKASNLLKLQFNSCDLLCRYRESNLDPMQEQEAFLITSLQPLYFYL